MKKRSTAVVVAGIVFVIGVFAAPSGARRSIALHATCSSGYTDGVIGGEHKCLRAGEFCAAAHESEYEHYGFSCVDGHLKSGVPAQAATTTAIVSTASTPSVTTPSVSTPSVSTPSGVIDPGLPVLLKKQTRHSGCRIGPLPDRRCSPGAYASKLTKAVICAPSFRTGPIRNVSEATKHTIEQEYGLAPKSYGRTLEIDHIISLELGGSNDPANLFPERANLPNHQPGFRIKDKLETKAAKAVCAGTITLSYAQHQIAVNWEVLYKKLYGVAPTG